MEVFGIIITQEEVDIWFNNLPEHEKAKVKK